ncbi:MAG: hypothetical protein AAF502_05620 [Bacteroidota bacterium]
MKNRIKQFFGALVLLLFLTAMSSCNRGMGCPNNFSIGELAFELVEHSLIKSVGLE